MKTLRKALLLLLCAALLCGGAFALEVEPATSAATVKSLEAEYTIAQDGSCTVLLSYDMTFSEGVREFSLPVPAEARNLSVSALHYRTARENGALLVTLSSSGQLADQTVLVSYRLPETVTATDEKQTCTLKLLLAERACTIEHYKATVTLPAEFESMPSLESGYYGDLIENYMDIGISNGVMTLVSRQTLRDHESLTMTLELPSGYFDLRFLAGKTARLDVILFWVFFAAGLVWWALFLRSRLLLPKAVAMPPLSGNPGAVPQILTDDRADLALMVLHWASLGYLSVTKLRSGRVLLAKQMDMGSERKSYEQRIFQDLFARNEVMQAPCDDYRIVRENAPTLTKAFWQQRLFVPHAGWPKVLRLLGAGCGAALTLLAFDRLIPAQGWRWFVIIPLALLGGFACLLLQRASACFLRRRAERTLLFALLSLLYLIITLHAGRVGPLSVLCIVWQLVIGLLLALGGRRTRSGSRRAEELLGLRRHLEFGKPEDLQQALAEDPQYFYRTLPYADALRVSSRFVRKMGDAPMEPCVWLQSERGTPQTAASFARLCFSVLDALREQTDAPVWNLLKNLLHRKAKQRERRT